MRVDVLTREYPPTVYGGAGVHVTELVRALRELVEVQVRAIGGEREEPDTTTYRAPAEFSHANDATSTLAVDLLMAEDVAGADVVHTHTWYANFGGEVARRLHDVPHVMTAHSLEPLRPWKAEQLGGGYRLSSWVEREAIHSADAVIAVSDGMRRDILRCYPEVDPVRVHVIRNGVDTSRWRPAPDAGVLAELGIDPELPRVVFVGRITRQKGLKYLLLAARELPENVQLVLCASSPDTPEIASEISGMIHQLQATRRGVVWVTDRLERPALVTLLSGAAAFVCPSIYEPLGIVNLEAMACATPVVATATGGIPEVVRDGETGLLVPIDALPDGDGQPKHEAEFVGDLAAALNRLLRDAELGRRLGAAGRERVTREFSWQSIAAETLQVYRLIADR